MPNVQGQPTLPSHAIIEDSYPLSPMQQGMLFNTLYAEQSGVDIEQMVCTLLEKLQTSVFERAWQRVVDRHTILRSTFRWEGVSDPLQVVYRRVDFRMEQQDWRDLGRDEQKSKLENYLQADRRRGFNMHEAPLMRGALFRLGEAEYQFVWTFSHALLDGRSFPILLREVFAFYEAFYRNQELELDLPRPFREHIQWLKQQDPSRSKDFWRGMLKGFTAPTRLGVDHPPRHWVAEEDAHGVQEQKLTSELTSALQSLAEKHNLTLNTLVQGAWALLLSRYSGDEDVVFGVTRACRSSALEGADSVVGIFINTLPMRVRVDSQTTLISWLKGLRAQQVAVREHEHTPLVTVQGWSDVPRGMALFDSILVFENYDLNSTLRAQGGNWLNREFHLIEQTNYPLTAAAYSDRELRLLISYDRQRFDDDAITRMLGHLEVLLNGMAANPERRLSELAILTEAERIQLLVEWNDTDADYPKDTSIHHLFEAQAARTPDAVGVVFEDQQLSYHELNCRANQLAHYLQALGVGPEVIVGICVERSLEMVIGLLGILKAGGAYVPLDPAYPQERLAFMLEDTQAPVLLTQQRLATGLPEHGAKVVYLDTDSIIAQESETNPIGGVMPENLAYVIYTSGSTGKPKGVGIEQRQLLNYLNGILERINLPGNASFATVSTIAADLGNTVIFSALCTGGCLHLISQGRASNPSAMADYLGNHAIDCLKIVPSHLAALQTTSHPEQLLPRKLLILGGEASRLDWVEHLRALAPDCTILNHYGPTEATIGVLTYRVEDDRVALGLSTLPLGRPIANSKIYLLDHYMQPVPIGVTGELYIGGVGLARGYLRRPALTAEKFIPDPFSGDPGARLYKTGDLARYLPDGNVEFLGRLDRQVKIRGFRIEPGEIEALLGQHPDLREVTVLAREDPRGSKHLIAYVVPNQNRSPRTAGQRRYKLPNNMAVAQLNKNETDYMFREIFESQVYLKHGITINDGDCIFDVGANIGLFTLFVNQICSNPRIYSFEPNPVVYEKLSANASLYGSGATLFNCGLFSETGTATFTFFPGFSFLSGFYADVEAEKEVVKTFMNNQQRAGMGDMAELIEQADEIMDERFSPKTFIAQLRTLSGIMEQERIDCIDLLKINAEKSELDILTGIKDNDWSKIKQIVLEVDTKENLDTILSLLESRGYDFLVEQDALLENTQLCYVYAMRPLRGMKLIREHEEGTHIRHLPVLSDPLLSISELKGFLGEKVPEYMVPGAFVFLDALPLTSNGKVDWRALPAPDTSRPELSATFVAPQTEMEKNIAAIWQQVLQLDKVGVLDNFFDLGGHSLLIVQVQSKLREVVSRDVSIADLFQYPTIQTLANNLSHEQDRRASLQKVVDRAKKRREALDRQSQLRKESRQIQ